MPAHVLALACVAFSPVAESIWLVILSFQQTAPVYWPRSHTFQRKVRNPCEKSMLNKFKVVHDQHRTVGKCHHSRAQKANDASYTAVITRIFLAKVIINDHLTLNFKRNCVRAAKAVITDRANLCPTTDSLHLIATHCYHTVFL